MATETLNTGTATITLPITDVDDVPPLFGKPVEAVCVANGAVSGAQITSWTEKKSSGTAATITGATGSMSVTSVREDITTTALFTVTATATGTPTYAFTSDGNPGAIADSTITAGAVNIASGKKLDYETNKRLVFKIVATDGTHNGTATITLPITDIDDVSPSFKTTVECVCVANGAVSGTRVIAVTATDPDTTAPTYSITSGNSHNDFVIANNGSVTVAKTLNGTAIPEYRLKINATDATKTDGTYSLIVYVGDCGVRCDNNNNSGVYIETHSLFILMMALFFYNEQCC